MNFVPDAEARVWLRDFVPDSDNFDRDAGNRTKNEKHDVRGEEIESIFYQEKIIFAGRISEPVHDEWRGLILGRSIEGRLLALIFTRRGDRLRPISCRPMRSGERRVYEAGIQEHS
ncbi:MAG: BrnT family toxin [Elusimicrobiota bacterium]